MIAELIKIVITIAWE